MTEVKLPYWLLRMLPMWDYICPKCKSKVRRNSHKCSNCGEQYGIPLKIPPKVLKDKDALKEYVHKEVFPRIASWQRVYLAQYFTIIFSDAFESGNFNAWTSSAESGGTADVETLNPHHGVYDAVFTTGTATNGYGWCSKSITAAAEVWQRQYLKIGVLPDTNSRRVGYIFFAGTGGSICYAGLNRDSSGNYQWVIRAYVAGSWTNYVSSSFTPSLTIYYCFELTAIISGTVGALVLYVSGSIVITQTGLDTNNRGNVNTIRSGAYLDNGNLTASSVVYIDCVVVADTGPIGQEVDMIGGIGFNQMVKAVI